MEVTVNGAVRDVAEGTTVAAIVTELHADLPRGVAVAVNGEVVPRAGWATAALRDGDAVEVLNAVAGG